MPTKVWNPYLEEYIKSVGQTLPTYGDEHFYRSISGDFMSAHISREKCLREYGFAVPNEEAIDAMVGLGPIVEIGCGIGYWAKLIQDAGGEIVPYDLNVNDAGCVKLYTTKNDYVPTHTQVFKGGAEVAELHSNMVLFLCWPPYETSMAFDCLNVYLRHGGHTLVYIGEGHGGCTGNDDFHNLIEERMECVRCISIPVWPGIHDRMEIYSLKSA